MLAWSNNFQYDAFKLLLNKTKRKHNIMCLFFFVFLGSCLCLSLSLFHRYTLTKKISNILCPSCCMSTSKIKHRKFGKCRQDADVMFSCFIHPFCDNVPHVALFKYGDLYLSYIRLVGVY